jgi:hypothetical protein
MSKPSAPPQATHIRKMRRCDHPKGVSNVASEPRHALAFPRRLPSTEATSGTCARPCGGVTLNGMRLRDAALASSVPTAVTAAVTGANRLGVLSVSSLASTQRGVGEGKAWLVVTSGLLADRPAIPSLVGFWLVGCGVLLVCSASAVIVSAVAGHTLSALGVYGLIGAARLVDPRLLASLDRVPDYGLSAMIAAWLGSIAAVLWSRPDGRGTRVLVALGSVGCAGIGLAFRPDVTLLDSEHVLAFAIGVAVVRGLRGRRLVRPTLRSALLRGAAAALRL